MSSFQCFNLAFGIINMSLVLCPRRLVQFCCWWSWPLGHDMLRGKGALELGFHGHGMLRNCRNVSLLPFLLELQRTWVTVAWTEEAGLMEWPGTNPLRERDTDTFKRGHLVKGLWFVQAVLVLQQRPSDFWGKLFAPCPHVSISIQIGTRTPLDSVVLRSEILLLFVG